MKKLFRIGLFVLLAVIGAFNMQADAAGRTDTLLTAEGPLKMTLIGHASLRFEFGGHIIYVDPWSKMADYSKMPKADLILITHRHRDHLDVTALKQIMTEKTKVVMTRQCAKLVGNAVNGPVILSNGDITKVAGLKIEAIPAYNRVHMRAPGQPYHPKGEGNGYVVTFGDRRVYVAGDTENTPEMKAPQNIDVAFLPMNLPYTMDSAMAADAATAFRPKILYPYHTLFSEDQVAGFMDLMKDVQGIEIRYQK